MSDTEADTESPTGALVTSPPPQPSAAAHPAVRRARRQRNVLLVVLAVALLVTIGAVVVHRAVTRYTEAADLQCGCRVGWLEPDGARATFSHAGLHEAINLPADPTRRQTFEVDIINDSDVSQTVLGSATAAADGQSGYRGVLTISTEDTRMGQFPSVRYTRGPVTIPAGGQYTLRYSVIGRCIGTGGNLIYDDLALRVRVGWFTRTEHVDFIRTSMVLTGTAASQAACSP